MSMVLMSVHEIKFQYCARLYHNKLNNHNLINLVTILTNKPLFSDCRLFRWICPAIKVMFILDIRKYYEGKG